MEQDWTLFDEIDDDDAPITEPVAHKVRDSAAAGCLICAIEEWDDE
jgi:hypothetical protein